MTIGEADDISKQSSKDLQDILKHLKPPEIPDYNSLKQDRLERIENLIIEQAIIAATTAAPINPADKAIPTHSKPLINIEGFSTAFILAFTRKNVIKIRRSKRIYFSSGSQACIFSASSASSFSKYSFTFIPPVIFSHN